uniref:glucuronosyltransferase n=1 Tax=Ditylenchus dipsaci TaxID=166011 RepID=A0A915DNT5_9BILA
MTHVPLVFFQLINVQKTFWVSATALYRIQPDVMADSSRAVFANTSPFLDFPMPTACFMLSRLLIMAGITIESKKKSQLNEKWNAAINNSSLGFWLVTFGSIAKTSEMPEQMQKALFHTFQQFPQITFFLKYESVEEELKQVRHNVYLARWIPQIDLLAHAKCLGILTHGGLSSILESIHHSRPMILMPLFADHFKNAKVIEHKQLGVLVDKESIHKDVFSDALRTVTYNKK